MKEGPGEGAGRKKVLLFIVGRIKSITVKIKVRWVHGSSDLGP